MKKLQESFSVRAQKRSTVSTFGLALLMGFTYLQLWDYIIPGVTEIINLGSEKATINHIGLIWIPIISYIFIASEIYILINIIMTPKSCGKGGIGLLEGLILGFIVGIIGGLLGSVIGGLLGSIYSSLMFGLILGLMFGLILGLIAGLIIGLIESLT